MVDHKFVVVAAAAALFSWAPLRAGDPQAKDQVKPAASIKPGPGGEMILFQDLPSVFGASKYEQKQSEAPASVTVITSEEIRRYGYRTLAEVLRSVRGFYTTYDRNYTYIGARGFNRPGDYDTRVLLTLDGHRLNDNIYDQASIGDEQMIDLDSIERIEIIRGPSSSLYGTNAFLAVINLVSRSGRDTKGMEVGATGSSFSTGEARVSWGNRSDGGVDTFVDGTYYDSAGQDLFYPEYDSPATNNGIARDADKDRFARAFGKTSFGNLRFEGGYSSREKGIPTGSYGTDFNDNRAQTTDSRGFAEMRYDRPVGTASRFVGTVSYDGYWYKGAYPYSGSLSRDYGRGQWWTGEARSITTLAKKHKVVSGVETRINTQQDQGYYDTNPYFLYLQDHRQTSFWAAYAQDEWRIRDGLILNAGVRHDHYETFGGTTNPRIGLLWSPTDETTLKFLYGRAFRAPNAYELYYDDGGFSQKANPDLQPETISTYEIVLERTFLSRLHGVGSVYRYSIDNLISEGIDPGDGLLVFDNIDRARADGIELEVEGAFARFLEGRVSYAWQKTVDESTDLVLTNSPRHLAKVNLSVPTRDDRYVTGVELQYTGSRATLSGADTGGFTVANLTFLARPWKRSGTSLSLTVLNLFDKAYGDPGGSEHVQDQIPQDGRSFRFQVRHAF